MKPVSETVKITLLGDIFPGELAFTLNYGMRSQFKNHKGEKWVEKINNICSPSDLIIGNLESPLLDENEAKKPVFYGHPEFAEFLKKCHINIINIANNHILEHGSTGFENTVDTLLKNDLNVVGHTQNEKPHIVYKTIGRTKIAIAGFSNVDLHKMNHQKHFAVLSDESVFDTLNRMQDNKADVKILCFHWGNEYIHLPALSQRYAAYKYIDAGASIIAGHHPHVVQAYEKYKNGHIFYSLGNFMFDYTQSHKVSTGMVAQISIEDNCIVNCRLKGVKLSYKNTVTPMVPEKFDFFYNKIHRQYETMKSKTDKQYQNYYHKKLKYNHTRERILMKLSLFSTFFRLSFKNKARLMLNVFNFYKNKMTSR